jgi:hypothetical protein
MDTNNFVKYIVIYRGLRARMTQVTGLCPVTWVTPARSPRYILKAAYTIDTIYIDINDILYLCASARLRHPQCVSIEDTIVPHQPTDMLTSSTAPVHSCTRTHVYGHAHARAYVRKQSHPYMYTHDRTHARTRMYVHNHIRIQIVLHRNNYIYVTNQHEF